MFVADGTGVSRLGREEGDFWISHDGHFVFLCQGGHGAADQEPDDRLFLFDVVSGRRYTLNAAELRNAGPVRYGLRRNWRTIITAVFIESGPTVTLSVIAPSGKTPVCWTCSSGWNPDMLPNWSRSRRRNPVASAEGSNRSMTWVWWNLVRMGWMPIERSGASGRQHC